MEYSEMEIKSREASLEIWKSSYEIMKLGDDIKFLEEMQKKEPRNWRPALIADFREKMETHSKRLAKYSKIRNDIYDRMEKDNV